MALVHLLCSVILLIQDSSGYVTLEQNGFKGLHVFISPSVDSSEWDNIYSGLKEAFRKTSETMYFATDARCYFSEFSVILPREWRNVDSSALPKQQNDLESEMVIHSSPASLYNNLPYLDHSRVCQANGDMMNFPSMYFKDLTYAGDVDKLMLKTWMSYRYGMFDELGYPQDSKYPAVYCDGNGVRSVTQCSNVPLSPEKESYVSLSGNPGDCECEGQNKTLPNCLYIPGGNEAQAEDLYSSIMGFHHIKRIQTFCDGTTDFYFHNTTARNLHNDVCNKKPIMDTMLEHYDFENGNNEPGFIDDTNPTKNIRLYQERTKIVFILDTNGNILRDTGSMIKSMLSEWVEEFAMHMHVGIVAVSGKYQHFEDIYPIQQLGTDTDIKDVKDAIEGVRYSGHGNLNQINAGLDHSIKMAEDSHSIVVLISDGSETEGNMTTCCMDEIKQKNINIVAIDVSASGNEKLKKLSKASEGMYFFPGQDSLQVYDALATASRTFSYPHPSKKVKILSTTEKIATDPVYGQFWIDASLTRVDLTFYLLSPILNDGVKITLTQNEQHGQQLEIDPANLPTVLNTINVTQAKVGLWYYSITCTSCAVGVHINGITKEGSDVISVDCQVLPTKVNSKTANMRILAKPLKRNMPVVGASVTAKAILDDGTELEVDMKDDGVTDIEQNQMDAIREDGVYTAVISSEIPEERSIQSIQCVVKGTVKVTYAHPGFEQWYDSFGENAKRPLCCGSQAPPPQNKQDHFTGDFRRITFSNRYN